jgi:hypothetical protein
MKRVLKTDGRYHRIGWEEPPTIEDLGPAPNRVDDRNYRVTIVVGRPVSYARFRCTDNPCVRTDLTFRIGDTIGLLGRPYRLIAVRDGNAVFAPRDLPHDQVEAIVAEPIPELLINTLSTNIPLLTHVTDDLTVSQLNKLFSICSGHSRTRIA